MPGMISIIFIFQIVPGFPKLIAPYFRHYTVNAYERKAACRDKYKIETNLVMRGIGKSAVGPGWERFGVQACQGTSVFLSVRWEAVGRRFERAGAGAHSGCCEDESGAVRSGNGAMPVNDLWVKRYNIPRVLHDDLGRLK